MSRSILAFRLLDIHILQLAIALEDMEDISAETGRISGKVFEQLGGFQLMNSQDFSIANAGGSGGNRQPGVAGIIERFLDFFSSSGGDCVSLGLSSYSAHLRASLSSTELH